MGLPYLALGLVHGSRSRVQVKKQGLSVRFWSRAMASIHSVPGALDVIMRTSRAKSYFASRREAATWRRRWGVEGSTGANGLQPRRSSTGCTSTPGTLRATCFKNGGHDSRVRFPRRALRSARTPFETPLDTRERFHPSVHSQNGSTVKGEPLV